MWARTRIQLEFHFVNDLSMCRHVANITHCRQNLSTFCGDQISKFGSHFVGQNMLVFLCSRIWILLNCVFQHLKKNVILQKGKWSSINDVTNIYIFCHAFIYYGSCTTIRHDISYQSSFWGVHPILRPYCTLNNLKVFGAAVNLIPRSNPASEIHV